MCFYIHFLTNLDTIKAVLIDTRVYRFAVLPKYEIDDIWLVYGLFAF